MKNVFWISRHEMTDEQINDLELRLNDSIEITRWKANVNNMDELKSYIADADVIAAVLPVEKLSELLSIAGGKPVICSKAKREFTGINTLLSDGTTQPEYLFRHIKWEVVRKIVIEMEDF